ncbi:hypothetical protein IKE67_07280 [bacterium]|nr:hypothetical protein [bacterium]
MKLQAITNPIRKIVFKGAEAAKTAPAVPVAKTTAEKVEKIGNGLNQPTKDEFVKEEKPFELPKDVEFKKPVLATKEKPYCQFDQNKVDLFVNAKEKAIPALTKMLNEAETEEDKTEGLFIANQMIAAGTKGMDKMYYGTFSKFNEDRSPNVQSMLSGVYRRILVPDAFGPLVKMLVTNIMVPPKDAPFDPNESIGGAILEHIKAPEIHPL